MLCYSSLIGEVTVRQEIKVINDIESGVNPVARENLRNLSVVENAKTVLEKQKGAGNRINDKWKRLYRFLEAYVTYKEKMSQHRNKVFRALVGDSNITGL